MQRQNCDSDIDLLWTSVLKYVYLLTIFHGQDFCDVITVNSKCHECGDSEFCVWFVSSIINLYTDKKQRCLLFPSRQCINILNLLKFYKSLLLPLQYSKCKLS